MVKEQEISTKIPQIDLPRYSDSEIIDLINSGEKVSRFEIVDIKKIVNEEGIVDEGHVARLARQMKSMRGQLTPILLRVYVNKDHEIRYQVADGFHRSFAFSMANISYPKATVMYNCDDEEFFDLRITAAQNVQPVKFSRMGEWIMTSYKNSKWAKMGYSISQLASLTLADSSGVRLGLTSEQTQEAKAYIVDKANRWGVTPVIFINNITTVEKSDPELVRKVRTFSGGSAGRKYLNPSRLKVIVDYLPKQYEKQKFVADMVISNNFNQIQTAAIALAIRLCPSADLSQIKEIFTISDPVEVAKHILEENNIQDINLKSNRISKKSRSRESRYEKSYENNYKSLEKLTIENDNLKKSIDELNIRLGEKNGGNQYRWWDNLTNLTFEERQILEMTLYQGVDIDTLLDSMKLTETQLLRFFISSYTKYRLTLVDRKIANALTVNKE